MSTRETIAPRRCCGYWVAARDVEAHIFNGWSLVSYPTNAPCRGCPLMCVLMEPPAVEQERAA